jgi:hypothetical protein
MFQTLAFSEESPVSKCDRRILCFYINATIRIQIIRITNIPDWYLERVVFPGQRLVFEAVKEAELEVYTNESATKILTNIIPCQQLRVTETVNAVEEFGD